MRPVILSLVFLGTTAKGCFFRADTPSDPSRIERIRLGNLRGRPTFIEPPVTGHVAELYPYERRILGREALKKACSNDAHFEGCDRNSSTPRDLKACLRKRGSGISRTCITGIMTWSTLLLETSRSPGLEQPAGEEDVLRVSASALIPHVGTAQVPLKKGQVRVRESSPAQVEEVYDILTPAVWPEDRRPKHRSIGGAGAPYHNHRHRHRNGAPREDQPPSHLLSSPRFGKVGPPAHQDVSGRGPRPSMFAVLTDWLFATPDDSPSDSSRYFGELEGERDAPFDAGMSARAVGADSVERGFVPAGRPRPQGRRGSKTDRGRFPIRSSWKDAAVVPTDDDSDDSKGVVILRPPKWSPYLGEADEEPPAHMLPPRPLRPEKGPLRLGTGRQSRLALPDFPPEFEVVHGPSVADIVAEGIAEGRLQHHARRPGGLPGPQHRGDRGSRDHIRYRNRHPEDNSSWFGDSFDSVEDFDLVEGALAGFFFIGSVTLLLLPFFLLIRALKKLVRHASGGAGAGVSTPDGYQALPEDAAAAALASTGQQRGAGNPRADDDAIVVTGTPVNPPPSIHV